jgi:ASC-1-like (ASCH) protein
MEQESWRMTVHNLKLNDKYFDAVANGIKTFEIRKNDRGFRVGDTLYLTRVNDDGNPIRSDTIQMKVEVKVVYIITHDEFPDGINDGYCILGIK